MGRGRPAFRPEVEALEARLAPSINFAAQQNFTFGSGPRSVAVADFNGDGKVDLAVANAGETRVSVSLNTTPPGAASFSFSPLQTLPEQGWAVFVAAGDFNGDGKPDLAAIDGYNGKVEVFLNVTPAGAAAVSFAYPQFYAVGSSPEALAVADLNGDGKPDLVVANSYDGTVSVLLNTTPTGSGTASFAAQQTFTGGPSLNGIDVSAGDLNGDGKPDLAVTNSGSNTVSVLLNQTPSLALFPAFAAQQTFAVGTGPVGILAADLDSDGKPDLVVTDNGGQNVSVLQNQTAVGATAASFAAQQTFATANAPQLPSVGDFNGAGRPDLAVPTSAGVSLLRNITVAAATAFPDAAALIQGQAVAITLVGSAPNGNAVSFAITANPTHGTLIGFSSATGQVTYNPGAAYLGPDSFQFTVTDLATNLASAAATINLRRLAGKDRLRAFGGNEKSSLFSGISVIFPNALSLPHAGFPKPPWRRELPWAAAALGKGSYLGDSRRFTP